MKNNPETERTNANAETKRKADRRVSRRRASYTQWEPRVLSFGTRKKRSKHEETTNGRDDRDHGVGYKKIEERRAEKGRGNGKKRTRNEGKRTRESVSRGRETEGQQARGGHSPSDLRYETLIKIISSASVGCRGAYTTASRECNDLNGNNSVKDGCSRPCTSPARPAMLLLFVPHEPRVKRTSSVGNTGGQSCTGDIVIWARIPASRTTLAVTSEDKNVRCADKNSRETREPERSKRVQGRRDRDRERKKEREKKKEKKETQSRSAIRLPRGEKKLNVALVLEQNMAHVTSRGTIGPAAKVQRARTSFACSIFLLGARSR